MDILATLYAHVAVGTEQPRQTIRSYGAQPRQRPGIVTMLVERVSTPISSYSTALGRYAAAFAAHAVLCGLRGA